MEVRLGHHRQREQVEGPMQRKASKGHLRAASDPNFHQSCMSDPKSKISWAVDATRTSQVENILW